MCYDAVSSTLSLIKYARHRGDKARVQELLKELEKLQTFKEPKFYVSGFDHPALLVFTNTSPYLPQEFNWGLIPGWTKDLKTAQQLMNQTLNAKGESVFDKPAFKHAAQHKRCLVYLDAFYEHHHAHKQTFPYHIAMKDQSPLAIAGLWEEWTDPASGQIYKTVTLVTTKANALMAKIHNNPKLAEPRMPAILSRDKQDEWLMDCKTDSDINHLLDLIKPFNEGELEAYTVKRLKGKNAVGNDSSILEPLSYPELSPDFEPKSLKNDWDLFSNLEE